MINIFRTYIPTMSRLPDFIIIGAGKCGTTSLHSYLNQHPQLYICPKKETYFFLKEPIRSKFKPWGAITEFEDYCSLFQDAPPNRVIGEISTTYYAYPDSAKVIYNTLPKVKILAILRDPADRAFSDYQMHVRIGNEKQDMSSLISPQNRFIKPGFYYCELIPYFEVFEKSQIKIFLFDDLCKNPIEFMQDLFRYLEVDDSFLPNIQHKGREGGLPKNQTVNLVLTQKNPLRSSVAGMLKLFMPLELRQKIRSNLIQKNVAKAKLSPSERQQLIEIYRSDLIKLQDLIGRDLSAWLK